MHLLACPGAGGWTEWVTSWKSLLLGKAHFDYVCISPFKKKNSKWCGFFGSGLANHIA